MTPARSSPTSPAASHGFDDEADQAECEGKFTDTEVEITFLLTIFGAVMWVCAAWIFAM